MDRTILVLAVVGIVIYSLLCSGCKVTKYIPTNNVDSTLVIIRDSLIRDSIEVPVPVEKVVMVTPDSDTSVIETSVARSVAFIDANGKLHHTLENKDTRLKAVITYNVPITTEQKYKIVNHIQEVEKPLSWWQKAKMNIGGYAIAAIAAVIIYYIIRLIRKTKLL